MKAIFIAILAAGCLIVTSCGIRPRPSHVFAFNGRPLATQTAFAITISADPSEVKAADNVGIDITVTNTSTHNIEYGVSNNNMLTMDTSDQYDIQDSAGNSVSKNTIKHPELASRSIHAPILIEPGESKKVGTDFVNVQYNLTQPGRYTIQMSRAVSASPGDGMVKSNKITVTVIP